MVTGGNLLRVLMVFHDLVHEWPGLEWRFSQSPYGVRIVGALGDYRANVREGYHIGVLAREFDDFELGWFFFGGVSGDGANGEEPEYEQDPRWPVPADVKNHLLDWLQAVAEGECTLDRNRNAIRYFLTQEGKDVAPPPPCHSK